MAANKFNPATDIPDQSGKVILITGGTTGLGAGSIKALASHNPAHIYFTGRNTTRANELIAEVHKSNSQTAISFITCDFTSLKSVQAATQQFLSEASRLDTLMCNAGIMAVEAGTSKDGYEIQFQVNHLAHALVIKNLLPILLKTAEEPNADVRIVNMTSIAYQQAPKEGIDFATLKSTQPSLGNALIPGRKWSRYGQSKLANMLYPQELAKRYPQILSVAIHPGIILTELFANVSTVAKLPVLISSTGKRTPVEQGPYNQLWGATAPRTSIKNGEYYEPIGVLGKRTTAQAKNAKLSQELWDWTQSTLAGFN